jgi:hypothetical protein
VSKRIKLRTAKVTQLIKQVITFKYNFMFIILKFENFLHFQTNKYLNNFNEIGLIDCLNQYLSCFIKFVINLNLL